MAKSGYLEKDRLANVIAAIQVMGVSELASGSLNRWVGELEASEELPAEQLDQSPIRYVDRKKWAGVFDQHPEFFKTYTLAGEQRVALRWRYAQSISFDPKSGLTPARTLDEESKLAGKPLTADQISVLITTAIELHSRAGGETRSGGDSFRPIFATAFGAILGSIVGGSLIMLSGWMHVPRIFD